MASWIWIRSQILGWIRTIFIYNYTDPEHWVILTPGLLVAGWGRAAGWTVGGGREVPLPRVLLGRFLGAGRLFVGKQGVKLRVLVGWLGRRGIGLSIDWRINCFKSCCGAGLWLKPELPRRCGLFSPSLWLKLELPQRCGLFSPSLWLKPELPRRCGLFSPSWQTEKRKTFLCWPLGHKINFSKYLLIGGSKVGGTKGQKIKI